MLLEEAKWVYEQIEAYFKAGNRILNLGSSTSYVRETLQPHMNDLIFSPSKVNGIDILHVDISSGEGIDVVGDLTNVEFLDHLKTLQPQGILCCNLLEHLEDRGPILKSLSELTSKGDILILTVPNQYPYHLDPIDTMYRPAVSELMDDLTDFTLINGTELIALRRIENQGKVYFHKNYFQQLKEDPKLFMRLLLRCFLPFYKPKNWLITCNDLLHMFHPFKVTCIVAKRN